MLPLSAVIDEADGRLRAGLSAAAEVWPTGFPMIDKYLGGGLRSGELTLLGGPQGLGKTTFVLQVLRNCLTDGRAALYFSFEHDPPAVLERLLALESGEMFGLDGMTLRMVREAMERLDSDGRTLEQRLSHFDGGVEALAAVQAYSPRLMVHRSRGSVTGVDVIAETVREATEVLGSPPVVVVDYLQKVFVPGGSLVEDERVTAIVEGLKDLALTEAVPLVAVVAADKEGLIAGKRLRVHNLRGSSALAYEADVVLLLNDKYDVVARHHLVFDVGNAERFRNWAVLTIEKNRSGLDGIDLEFRKRFEQGRYETDGGTVTEQLVDERVFVE